MNQFFSVTLSQDVSNFRSQIISCSLIHKDLLWQLQMQFVFYFNLVLIQMSQTSLFCFFPRAAINAFSALLCTSKFFYYLEHSSADVSIFIITIFITIMSQLFLRGHIGNAWFVRSFCFHMIFVSNFKDHKDTLHGI